MVLLSAGPAHADGVVAELDAPDVAGGPLDLTQVAFGQDGADMILQLTTAGDWSPSDLSADPRRSLCVELLAPPPDQLLPRARICVVDQRGNPALRVIRLGPDGAPVADRPMRAHVSRANAHSIAASFGRAEAELPFGPYSWQAESSWFDAGGCAQPPGCLDRAPDSSAVAATIGAPPPLDQVRVLTPRRDARDDAGGALDLTQVTFGQRGADLVLQMVAAGAWTAADLSSASDRSLCVRLFHGAIDAARARVCVVDRYGKAALRYTRLDPAGQPVASRHLTARVLRPARRSLRATFSPDAVGLHVGWYSWRIESSATGAGACAQQPGCVDRVPDAGNVIARIAPQPPRCFGAASRDRRHRCDNPRLRRSVVPTPANALIEPNAPCTLTERTQSLYVCRFGVDPAARRIALVGDSHAEHWRAAVEVVAEARGWKGVSVTRSSCPFTTATTALAEPARSHCKRWTRAVPRWFAKHPMVSTVFISENSFTKVIATHGKDSRAAQLAGYMNAWKGLPSSVRHIIVIRDTPTERLRTRDCVAHAMATRGNAGHACAEPRGRALRSDPATIAAARLRSRRVHVVDLTRLLCSTRRCYPVIGGALVHKDGNHLTEVFARTLGPFLLRAARGFI